VFDKFGPESGRAFFELFFWMFDQTRATAESYPGATFLELEGHGHVLVLEPGAEKIARRIAE